MIESKKHDFLLGTGGTVSKAIKIFIKTVPSRVYTSTQGVYMDPESSPRLAHTETQNLTWLFHLVFESQHDDLLRIEEVDVSFIQAQKTRWKETLSREYLERMEWIDGAFRLTAEYFLANVDFVDTTMIVREKAVPPDLPAGGVISLVRIPFCRPWFIRIDQIEFHFRIRDSKGHARVISHSVAIDNYRQKTSLRLPFAGIGMVASGNDLATGHRRTGLNRLTAYGWDFVKIGENGFPYRTDGQKPEDHHVYGEPVLAAADGLVVDVRNDIPDYGIMTEGKWLEAMGMPSLFSNFERVRPRFNASSTRIALGNPLTG